MSVDWHDLLRALGLVMVIEGIMPFAAPMRWRQTLFTLAQYESRTLRIIGAVSLTAGATLLNVL